MEYSKKIAIGELTGLGFTVDVIRDKQQAG
jgi:hypothetical protein